MRLSASTSNEYGIAEDSMPDGAAEQQRARLEQLRPALGDARREHQRPTATHIASARPVPPSKARPTRALTRM